MSRAGACASLRDRLRRPALRFAPAHFVSTTQVDSIVSCWLHDVRTLATRNFGNETLRRRFICIATHLFVRQDSRIRVAPLTACSALRAIPSLRSALTAFGGYVLITSRFVCDSCSFHHDSSAKLVLAYQTLTHSSCLSHLNPDPEEPPPALRGRLHRRPRLEDYNN